MAKESIFPKGTLQNLFIYIYMRIIPEQNIVITKNHPVLRILSKHNL